MAARLNRSYKLLIQQPPIADTDINQNGELVETGTYSENAVFLEIDYPLTVDFFIERTTSSSLNFANFAIRNLSQKTSSRLVKDRFNLNDRGNGKELRKVIFQAGYNELSTIFVGSLIEGYSERNGVDFTTHLYAQDGAYEAYNSYSKETFAGGTSMRDIFIGLIKNLGLPQGNIGAIDETKAPLRGAVYNGNTFELLQNNFDNRIFIDLEKVNLLDTNEAILGQVPLLTSETGLLGVPKRQETYLLVDIIFEPRIMVGQIVEIRSSVDARFNGQFKVMGMRHSGTISGAVGGDCKTTLMLSYGTAALGGLKAV